MDAQFKCDITTKGLSSFMAKQADGPQSNDKFKFNFTVDAPEQVTVGEEFDYTIKGGFVGLPKSFPVAGVATVNITTVEQARLFVDLPDNIEVTNIAAAGGQRGRGAPERPPTSGVPTAASGAPATPWWTT